MSDIINDAQEAFEDGLKVAAESTVFIGAIETGNMPIAITTGTALLSDVQSFIKDSVKIFNDGKEIFEGAKAEVNSPEFKKFQTDLAGVKKNGAVLFAGIKKGTYGEIPDDLAECVEKLKVAVSEASELIEKFWGFIENVEDVVEDVANVVANVANVVANVVEDVANVVANVVEELESDLNSVEDFTFNTI